MHTFLNKYDLANVLREKSSSAAPLVSIPKSRGRLSMQLQAFATDKTFDTTAVINSMEYIKTITKVAEDQVDALKESIKLSSRSNDTLLNNKERKERLLIIIKSLGIGLVEREEETKLVLFTVLCGEHLLLLGPPGTPFEMKIQIHDSITENYRDLIAIFNF